MRILAVSEESRSLDDIRKACSGLDLVSDLAAEVGAIERMNALPAKGEVNVLLLDCRQGANDKLLGLERIAGFYPALNTILIVDQESPDLLLRALRLGVREVIRWPVRREEVQTALQHILQKSQARSQGQGRVLSFMSCKGGGGASFVATNLGYVLAADFDKKVLLIDLNRQFGDAVLYVSDRRPSMTVSDIAEQIQRIDMALLKSAVVDVLPNYAVLAAPDDPTHAADIRPSQVESLIRFARMHFDCVIVDLGRALDTCSIQALDLSDHAYPVLQLTLPFLRDAKRLFDVFRSLEYGADKVRPIMNRLERGGELTLQDAERPLPYKIFASLPNHYKAVTASVNLGVPISRHEPSSPVTRGLRELAAKITGMPQPRRAGLLARMFHKA